MPDNVPGLLELRDQYAADIVQMLLSNTDQTGLGYVTSSEGFAYSVVDTSMGFEARAHELGHNFGCNVRFTRRL